jgi:hypothetical protein
MLVKSVSSLGLQGPRTGTLGFKPQITAVLTNAIQISRKKSLTFWPRP